jgi:hypothetical protein
MQVSQHQIRRMRILAAELRDAATDTTMPDYQAKFEHTAREIEEHAPELEYRPRLAS